MIPNKGGKVMPYFDLDKLKVGDLLWDISYGFGTLVNPNDKYMVGKPIKMSFPTVGARVWYSLDGKENENWNQTLFYNEVKFEPPPRPKRKIKRREVYENITWHQYQPYIFPESPHGNFNHFLYLTYKPPMTMTLEWEEEE